MRLHEIVPELSPQAWQRWGELARSVPPHDPLRLLKYPSHVEIAAKRGIEAAAAMLDLFDGMLRALVAAGVDGRIEGHALNGVESVYLTPPYWLLLDGLAARTLRRAIDLGNDRIHLPGESFWDGGNTVWDHGESRWDIGAPETDRATIKGVVVDYPDQSFAVRLEAAAVAAKAQPQAAPTLPQPAQPGKPPRRPGKQARRVRLVHDNEERTGWQSATAAIALNAALEAARKREDKLAIAVLAASIGDGAVFEMWRAVEALRADPQASIAEILRRLR